MIKDPLKYARYILPVQIGKSELQKILDIDDEIEKSQMRPKEGFIDDGQDGEDNVSFGKTSIDKIISAVGDEIFLPLLSIIVNNAI